MPKKIILLSLMALTLSLSVFAQQPLRNTAFKSGESLTYNLYYNWQFIWVKAGTASMTTTEQQYQGQRAYKSALTTRGNGKVDKMFVLRDTILCYTSTDLVPLYYRKGAREGKRYYVDELFYKYSGGKCDLTMKALHSNGTRTTDHRSSRDNIYDMMSIFLRARNYSNTGWQKGHTIKFPIADGDGMKTAKLTYRGKSTVKADDGKKYKCLELSYLEPDDKNKDKEIVRFFVTDDSNHIPVRLDMFLKFGSAKAFLVNMKGNRNTITAETK